jgi:hypothetical protein
MKTRVPLTISVTMPLSLISATDFRVSMAARASSPSGVVGVPLMFRVSSAALRLATVFYSSSADRRGM